MNENGFRVPFRWFQIVNLSVLEDETKDYEDVELTTREDISEFQELQEPLYEKLDEIVADGCTAGQRIVKYSKGCVTWSGGYISEGEEPDYFVRY